MQTVDLRRAKTTLAELAYQHILNAILSQQMKPGERLRPEELASSMNISPTPVKYALARLSGEGLVEYRDGQGPFVTVLAEDETLDLYDSRLMCELYAVNEGIRNVDESFVSRARELLSNWSSAPLMIEGEVESKLAMAEFDNQFHAHLLSLLPNARTVAWGRQLNVYIKSVRVRVILEMGDTYGRSEAVRDEHEAILRALERRDAVEAASTLRHHVANSKEVMRLFFGAKLIGARGGARKASSLGSIPVQSAR